GNPFHYSFTFQWNSVSTGISALAIAAHLVLRFSLHMDGWLLDLPLWIAVTAGGVPLLYALMKQLLRGQFGSDFLAGLSIVTATVMGELLVATIIVLMLSGGQALEEFATKRASAVLTELAKRTPSIAHRIVEGIAKDIAVAEIAVGDHLVVYPHEICPVDGTVISGSGTMDESFLTGEPFRIRKIAGSQVISGALNEDTALTILAEKQAVDSRYARIMDVMRRAEDNPPRIRRLADQLGALYTPVAVAVALAGWWFSGDPNRFLGVIVIATPCPLLLAIPVAIIGSISLAARHGIVIKKPVVLEQVAQVRTMMFDKTGTLTHGEPVVTDVLCFGGADALRVLGKAASLEQYSKHPLAGAILRAAEERKIVLEEVENISERPGQGLSGVVRGEKVLVTGRRKLPAELAAELPEVSSGMECVIVIADRVAGLLRFHDRPRLDGEPFISHLRAKHNVTKLMILSGDRDAEVQHLARIVGISDVRASLEPEEKLQIVRKETEEAPTLFLGDGINDAPAMMTATVGVAFGQNSDITAEAAGAVILEPTLERVNQLLHVGRRMRSIALQSAVGGMALSSLGMLAAALGYLPPLQGAIGQEVIDLLAVLNAVRASISTRETRDF
ncbi:MAG TPA: heavy metal translocating P-type ATPase, partial [Terracidiphilus sp.]|nr:heavy metal translocating P-type ATPase [Terracidiphilus sp.]